MCMFWTASDVLKLRLEQKRVEEAEKIYEALKRMLPRIEEIEVSDDQPHHKGQARGFMKFAEGRLIKESERFRKRYFAIRDKKKRVDIPSDNPSKPLNAGQTKVLDCIKAHPGLKVPGISDEAEFQCHFYPK